MRNLLGGKGANLAEMASIGLPVPPGFTITTEVCTAFYENDRKYPDELDDAGARRRSARIEKAVGLKFGDKHKPLLVSVRSGARVSMPGHDGHRAQPRPERRDRGGPRPRPRTIPRFAWDCYRRFIQMYGSVVLGVDHHRFEEIIEHAKLDAGVIEDTAAHRRRTGSAWSHGYKDMVRGGDRQAVPAGPRRSSSGAPSARCSAPG